MYISKYDKILLTGDFNTNESHVAMKKFLLKKIHVSSQLITLSVLICLLRIVLNHFFTRLLLQLEYHIFIK